MNNKVVLVTGSNKGIGYGTVEMLLKKKSPLKAVLTSRNVDLGKRSYEGLLVRSPEIRNERYLLLSSTRYHLFSEYKRINSVFKEHFWWT